ncbi:MAG: 3-isopropylmalate dehydratase small subunit [Candidatus Bathyarchaeia archaeon]
MTIQGKVIKYGNNVNTDVIIPSKYLVLTDPFALAAHAMEALDSDFSQKIKERKIVVAGRNFGCGSSREQAPIALKYAGITCIVADSFARIFYRNAINIGLPLLECDGISAQIHDGDELRVNLEKGLIEDVSQGLRFNAVPIPSFLMAILEKGLVDYIKSKRSG